MADLYEPDIGTAFYRTRDPIKNLKIRVRLERVTSASLVPQAQVEQEAGDDVELRNMKLQENIAGQTDTEEFTFGWQQKIFCQREVDFYSQAQNCETVLERKYNQETNLLKEVGRPTKRLFCYVDHDAFTNRDEQKKFFTTSPNEQQTLLAEKMSNVRYRRNVGRKHRDESSIVPKMNVVDPEPGEESRKHNHVLNTPVQTMYIMADLTPKGRAPTEDDEFVLCTIRADSNGVISIKPDFSKGKKGYKVEAAGMGRDLFDFTVDHSSIQMSRQDQARENKMIRELYGRHSEFLSAQVGHEFEMPPADVLRMIVYGEIETARDFEHDDLYVQFFVDLPPYWQSDATQQLAGVTHRCRTKTDGRDQVAYFSYPFSFELFYRNDSLNEKKDEVMMKWPQFFLEVCSLDSWQRHRTEGYGYITLPTKAGVHKELVHCWRPLGRSTVAELRRFFIGGSPELEDPTYAAIPSTFEGNRLSKFGFRTVSTGSVSLRFNVIQQSQAFLRSATSKKKMGSIMDRLGTSVMQSSIINVIEAFQKARSRMVAARENLKQDYIETIKAYESDDQ